MTLGHRVWLSCCLVARNEAALIEACIESARPVVDEVVLVDTGSTDGTPELAERAGARVIRAPWPGDLGQAHDLPVAHARGDWVLVLDGDEVLDPAAAPALRDYVASGGCEGYRLPIRNYSYLPTVKWRRADPGDPLARGALGYMPSSPVRLFRHGRGYRHQGFLHQSVVPSIRAAGGRIGTAAVPIHHYGYLRVEAPKRSLYVALALRQAAATPRSARVWIDLGHPLLVAGRRPAAAAAFHRAHVLGGGASASFWLGEALLQMGRPAGALRYLHEAVARNARDQAPDFERADAWEHIARAEEALGRPRAAAAAYRRALALRPDSPVALNDLAGLLAERGATRQAEALVSELLRHYAGLDMAWATLGTLRVREGRLGEARRAFARALDIAPLSRPARVNLAACRALAAGRVPRATAAAHDHPLALHPMGPGGVLSVIALLGGGGGRVLVEVVRALRGRPQHAVCFENAYATEGQTAELARLGVGLVTVASEHGLRSVIRRLRPATVIFHGWPNRTVPEVVRGAGERWIAVGHNVVPMPLGADDYVVISDFHASRQRHLPAARVRHIPNGVELARFGRRTRRGRGPVTIVMLSRLDPAKFARRLLDYLPRLDALGARLLIAGRGPRRAEIEPELAERGLGRAVRFVGPIPGHKVPAFLAAADVGLHLTETAEEACSLALLEMLASGLPIVAEPKGCVPEMVSPGENGFLSLEPKQVAADLERLILSPALRRRFGAASRRRARRWSMARFRRAWRALVDGPRPAPAPVPVAPRRYEPWRPSLAVLVCGTPRSGSGLLCEALRNTGLVGHPDDFFEPETARELAARWGEPPSDRYLELALEDGSSPNGVFAARLSLAGLRTLRELLTAAPRALPPTRYVWIVRRDRVRQAISWERAEQGGTWARLAGERPLATPRPRFDAGAIARRLAEIERQEAAWRAWFEGVGATPIHVAYEDLAADYETTARSVARALAIEVPAALSMGERTLLAMADPTTERWVRRFERR